MIDKNKWNIDYIGEKIIKPMYEDSTIPFSLADEIKKAIENQISEEPEYIDEDANYFICPSCREPICSSDELITHKYCLNCGKSIDWRKYNERN